MAVEKRNNNVQHHVWGTWAGALLFSLMNTGSRYLLLLWPKMIIRRLDLLFYKNKKQNKNKNKNKSKRNYAIH